MPGGRSDDAEVRWTCVSVRRGLGLRRGIGNSLAWSTLAAIEAPAL